MIYLKLLNDVMFVPTLAGNVHICRESIHTIQQQAFHIQRGACQILHRVRVHQKCLSLCGERKLLRIHAFPRFSVEQNNEN